jgi:predicted GH43/DUF377 family glycosyl hydrolase
VKWRKLGIVWGPNNHAQWAQSHATCPTPYLREDGKLRIYFASRDKENVGRIGYVDTDPNNPKRILAVSETPALDIGVPGTFDDNGVVATALIKVGDGQLFLYYAGFEICHHIRYRMLTGLAVSSDRGESFRRISRVPILERSDTELHFRSGPSCLAEPGVVRAWYAGGMNWVELNGKTMPSYDVRYVESSDGIHWPAEGAVHIAITEPDEHGFGRPCVIPKAGGGYRMFYSVRRRSFAAYRLGYAESKDGFTWRRMDDKLHLDVTPGSFDSDAIMYAAPIQVGNRLYVYYNGNEFGRDGFALAVLEEE